MPDLENRRADVNRSLFQTWKHLKREIFHHHGTDSANLHTREMGKDVAEILAKELGIDNVKAVFMDVTDDGVPSFIAHNILQAPELKPGQRAAIVVRLYYEDGIKAGREMQGARTDLTFLPNGKKVNTYKMLAKKAGVGQGSIGRLIPVYRNRPDLFELVFDGTYTINKAYTPAHAREV